MDIKEICKKSYEDCISLLANIISCESLSGKEESCVKVLTNYFSNNNIPYFIDSRGSIAVVCSPLSIKFNSVKEAVEQAKNNNLKILVYNAHMDVVAADNKENWQSDPFKLSRRDGKIYGRGTADMKGALAAMASSIKIINELDSYYKRKCLVIGCFVTEEEVAEGLAFKNLCEEFEFLPDMVILGEPSKMEIARGQRGKLEMTVETRGIASHTSVPETADNAAYKMARALLAIEQMELEEREKYGLGAENTLKRTTIVGSGIEVYPVSKSFVPDKAIIHVTCRLALGQTMQTVSERLKENPNWPESKIESLVYRGKSYTGKNSEWVSEHNGWETTKDSELFKKAYDTYIKLFKKPPVDKIWPFSTDGVYCAGRLHIPTLGIGPGYEELAHKDNEWVKEEDMLNALEVYCYLPFC